MTTGEFVDVEDFSRKRLIQDAEDRRTREDAANSRVLRVSGKVPYGPHRRLSAIVVRERVTT